MAAPMVTRKRNFVRKFHLPVSYPSETTFQNFSAYRSISDNIGNCSNAHQSILSNSHGFSCSLPLPLVFDYGKQTKDEKKVNVNKQVSTYPNSCLAYIPRDEYSGCLMLPSGPEFKDVRICCIEHRQGHCIEVKNTTLMDVHSRVVGIHCKRVQGQEICSIEHRQGHCIEVKNTTLMDVHSRVVGIHCQRVQGQGICSIEHRQGHCIEVKNTTLMDVQSRVVGIHCHRVQGQEICNTEHRQGHCVEVKNTTLMDVHSRVVGIHCQRVQGQDFVIIQTITTWYMCSLNRDTNGSYCLNLEHFIPQPKKNLHSAGLSPYIAQEACMATKNRELYLWCGGKLERVCEDKWDIQLGVISYWCNVHYGSHPRCLVYSDCSSVRVYDIRCPTVTPLKLFTKEDLHSDDRDQFRVCQNSSLSTFNQTLATDNNVYLLDERFPKMPLLKVPHMLQSPPAFMTEFCYNDDVHLYLGSLQKPDIHRVSWRSSADHPPHVLGSPYRIPRKIDLLGCPDTHCKNTKLVTDKLSSSLLGLQTITHDKGHTVIQLDRNGEVFYQVFQEKSQQLNHEAMEVDNSELFPESSNVIEPSLDIAGGVKQIRDWMDKWDKGPLEKKDVNRTRDISTFFSGSLDIVGGVKQIRDWMDKWDKGTSEKKDVNRTRDVSTFFSDNSEQQFPKPSNDTEPQLDIVGGVKHVRDWMDKWDKGSIEKKVVNRTRDISTFFSGLVEGFPGFIACPLCMGTISEVVDVTQYSHVKCPACQNRVSDASAVKTGARKDSVVPKNNSKVPKRKRESAEDGKVWNKLSHALYDGWYGDPEASSPTEKLKEDDKG